MTARPAIFAAMGVVLGAVTVSALLTATAPTSGRINLGTNIQRTINEGGICVQELHVDYQAERAFVRYQTCDNANPPNYTGHQVTLQVTPTGFELTRPFQAPTTGTTVTFTNVAGDLTALPAAIKTLMRRAVTGT